MNNNLSQSLYHSFLRVAVCVLALTLVFDSGLLFEETVLLSNTASQHVASVVGVTVGVEPTELNQLTARITELETELEAKERLIAVSVGDTKANPLVDSTFVLSVILFILLVLVVLNYVLDYLRARPKVVTSSYGKQTQSPA